jgi:hypothetical protein
MNLKVKVKFKPGHSFSFLAHLSTVRRGELFCDGSVSIVHNFCKQHLLLNHLMYFDQTYKNDPQVVFYKSYINNMILMHKDATGAKMKSYKNLLLRNGNMQSIDI